MCVLIIKIKLNIYCIWFKNIVVVFDKMMKLVNYGWFFVYIFRIWVYWSFLERLRLIVGFGVLIMYVYKYVFCENIIVCMI